MIFDPILDIFRGRAITIPPLDGALRPNTALDEAEVLVEMPAPDNLVWSEGRLLWSSGADLLEMTPDGPVPRATFSAEVTAVAVAADGTLAVASDDGRLNEAGQEVALPGGVACITALAYGPDGALWLANGSARHPASAWVVDLMEKGATGSLWRRAAGGAFEKVAGELGWPNGLLPDAAGVTISESWRHCLLRLEGGKAHPVLRHLPGYPGRLSPAADGGAWLSVFAPRTRLIEFVLLEKQYRYDMMAEFPADYWIAPALRSGGSFLEPLQCGGIRTMGVHKAWSPSRSYGLVVRLGPDMAPLASYHSRANGKRHGVTSALEAEGRLFMGSKGGDAILTREAH
ncbi:hypothetical protein U5922_006950 [Aquicoccus sp. G2-2]|uniref:hypothetical protein n=1 Tax=Aquicoccus sp. G2-2 TaxID=3092120 RepID=UPI002ADF1A6A|nr:hypothetical protein [Aquicoccus sp. G2-2]MEA1113226.1 hypothetical protein [Aquicoccus sp. G2-2]